MYKLSFTLLVLLALAGCAAPQGATPTPAASASPSAALPTPVPTLAPSDAPAAPTAEPGGPPAPTAAPSAAPATVPPASGDLLPAPLFVLDNGQIARIEPDGKTRNLITDEQVDIPGLAPIATFAMSPQGLLAFVVGDLKADRLVVTNEQGQSRQIIYEQQGHELSNLAWSPDGAWIYLRLLNNRQPPDIPSGAYRIAAAGGKPELLRADDEPADVANPAPSVSGYRPFAASPDGKRLLVEVYSLFYDGCGLGVISTGGDESNALVRLDVPPGTKTYCGEATWSPDSAAVYFLAGPESGPTIWRGDAASGATAAQAGPDVLARAPYVLPGGELRFFLVDRSGESGEARFAMAELSAPQAQPRVIGQPFSERLGRVLWAPDGHGAVAVVAPPDKQGDLRWLAVDFQPVPLPNSNIGLGELAWGPVR